MNSQAYIAARARALGLDPRAVQAVESMEGGSGRIGDGGHAFGPFQENNAGGVLTGRFKGASQTQLQNWAWSKEGINDALNRMAQVAGGLKGNQAVQAIVGRFERPENPSAEIAGAEAHYGKGGGSGPMNVLQAMSGQSLGGGSSSPGGFNQLLASYLLQSAQNGLSGHTSGGDLLQLAMARKALGAGPVNAAWGGHEGSGADVGGKAGQGQSGLPPIGGGKANYSNIQFGSGVDWQHVNPMLLGKVNQVAQHYGVTVNVNSGYRSDAHSKSVGGFAGDPHTKGVAIDGYINGKPIGQVIPASVWAKFGVQSGDVPNFFNGSPDPEHLQLTS